MARHRDHRFGDEGSPEAERHQIRAEGDGDDSQPTGSERAGGQHRQPEVRGGREALGDEAPGEGAAPGRLASGEPSSPVVRSDMADGSAAASCTRLMLPTCESTLPEVDERPGDRRPGVPIDCPLPFLLGKSRRPRLQETARHHVTSASTSRSSARRPNLPSFPESPRSSTDDAASAEHRLADDTRALLVPSRDLVGGHHQYVDAAVEIGHSLPPERTEEDNALPAGSRSTAPASGPRAGDHSPHRLTVSILRSASRKRSGPFSGTKASEKSEANPVGWKPKLQPRRTPLFVVRGWSKDGRIARIRVDDAGERPGVEPETLGGLDRSGAFGDEPVRRRQGTAGSQSPDGPSGHRDIHH